MKFKVKRHWWIWALGILYNLLAIKFLQAGIYLLAVIMFAADIAVIFPEIHLQYIFEDRHITIQRLIYPNISIAYHIITAVEYAPLLTFQGFALKIMEDNMGAYKITYSKSKSNHKRAGIVFCPKNQEKFMSELALHIDKKVILINNTESAFKRKKDRI